MPERRILNFSTFDEAMAEAERVAHIPVRTSGRYSAGQILEHLARVLDVVSGETPAPSVARPMRWLGRGIRPLVLRWRMRPGFKLPATLQTAFWPSSEIAEAEAWAHLQQSARRFRQRDPLPPHPFFGPMNRRQSETLQCRHFELHLGFIHPTSNAPG